MKMTPEKGNVKLSNLRNQSLHSSLPPLFPLSSKMLLHILFIQSYKNKYVSHSLKYAEMRLNLY